MTVNSVRAQAKEALLDESIVRAGLNTVADTYLSDPSPTLEQTVSLAESFGAVVRVVVEFPDTQPPQQD